MKTTIKNLLHPSVVDFLGSLERRTGASKWVYGDYSITIEDTGSFTTNLDRQFDTSDKSEWLALLVYNTAEQEYSLLRDCNLMNWTVDKLKSLMISNSIVTVQHVADQFMSGRSMFYKKLPSGYVACNRAEADWVSLPADEHERFLPMGYPLVFIECELTSRDREFDNKTPDMCVDVDEFFRFYRAGMTEISSHETSDGDGGEYSIERERTIRVDGNTYSVRYHSDQCCEGVYSKEEWKKNGELHRLSGPAETVFHDPSIPEEGHLAKDVKDWYQCGKFIRSEDSTDESIVANWHPAQREYFGYV